MKLTCSLCGGMLEKRPDGAVCRSCGLEHSESWLQEKLGSAPPAAVPHRTAAKHAKSQRNLSPMWVVMVLIGLYEFIGVLSASSGQQEATVFLTSAAAMIVTLLLFRPWQQ